jgi:ethanolamine ammonia-lyase small subunit
MSEALPPPLPESLALEAGPLRMSDLVERVLARTPARILVGRAGPSYLTATQLQLRLDHAAALDAVHAEIDLDRDLGRDFVERFGVFEVASQAGSKPEFLMRPDLGRRLGDQGRGEVVKLCLPGAQLQIAIGDGLSAAAVAAQVPSLLPLIDQEAQSLGWTVGRPFFVRYCRVGLLNDIGALLDPAVVVLLIGERPGLASADSLSAYLAYHPRPGHTDAQRNLISNIHARGVPVAEAAHRIIALAEKMGRLQASGVAVKEDMAAQRLLSP